MEDLKIVQAILKVYKDGLLLDVDLTGRSEDWLKGFFHAFEKVDSIFEDYLYSLAD